MDQPNQFDNLFKVQDPELVAKQKSINIEMQSKLDNLIHRVFKQNKDGAELLSIWKEALILTPTVTPNSTQMQVGIEEGRKEFIRRIYLTIKNVEL